MPRLRSAAVAVSTLALALGSMWLAIQAWLRYLRPFTGDRPATCWPDNCFCEAIRSSGLAQPANTWSCVTFLWVAFVIAADARRLYTERPPNALGRQPVNALVFAVALILTGVGSAIYHASLTFVGQFTDVMGMYFIGTFLIIYQMNRKRRLSTSTVVGSFLLGNTTLALVLWYVPAARRFMFAVLLGIVVYLEYRRRSVRSATRPVLFASALAVIVVGFGVWILDITRLVCAPTSLLQGHAVWHVAGALSSLLVYRYFRTERSQGATLPSS